MKKIILAAAAGLALVAGQAVAVENSATARVADRVSWNYADDDGYWPAWSVIGIGIGIIALGAVLGDEPDSQ